MAAAVVLTACTTDATPGADVVASAVPTTTSPSAPGTTLVPSADRRAGELCARGDTRMEGRLANSSLDEASGLVASRRHDGVLWSHNDGSERPGLFGVGGDGADLGFHPLPIEGVVDVEDIAIQTGADGDWILLADIGDNREERTTIRIYRFPEPDPAAPAPLDEVEVLEFVYPDRAYNAEALLVDDEHDSIVIVTKQQQPRDGVPRDLWPTAPAPVFEGPLTGHGAEPLVLQPAGVLDAPELETRTIAAVAHPTSIIGNGGVPTGGDVSPDGALVALRTYETIWVWPREPGQRVADVFAADPCQVLLASERQGEAIAFDGDDLVTVSEGAGAAINRVVP